MPTKNRLKLLKRAICSVVAQTYNNIELIIVDDGSTDGTRDYLISLASEKEWVKVLFNDESLGACNCRNKAISLASGDFVTGLDDDDEFMPERLSSLLAAYDPNYSFVCAGIFWHYGATKKAVGAKNMVISKQDILSKDYAFNQVLVEKQRIIDAGLFDEDFPACQDWDMWTRLILKYGDAKRIGVPLYTVHVGHDEPRISTSGKKLAGYMKYFNKYASEMSAVNLRDHSFIQAKASGKRASLSSLTSHNWVDFLKYSVTSLFPALALIRLKRLKGKS
ncbi:glycosyltransferase [Alteromonas facilis]|uniref:glycosyltransferase n=1 Tax=Alteromonas facilis TaxID=2048004 RepID=UPI000C2896DB|nr:glycosyltransferase [Alteromonas facilis]